jgi:exodeoxyribonuclease VII large subunit
MTFESQVTNDSDTTTVLTVSELNGLVAESLMDTFGIVWLTGEVSAFTRAASGHLYMTLKDQVASVRAVMFRTRIAYCEFQPEVGDQIQIRAKVGLYEPRGEFQLNVQMLRRAGRGTLHEQFLLLKNRLQAEGLFDLASKRVPSSRPRAIGVITSLGAAALQDVLTTLARRAPHVSVFVYPALVQGPAAPRELRLALAAANQRQEVDTILLVRGGGSLEDLWAFNDEGLARDISASPLPVIAGVGHESDVSIADFVADVRAPTPTAAAELACQPVQMLLEQLQGAAVDLQQAVVRKLERHSQQIDRLNYGLVSPVQRLAQRRQALALLLKRLEHRLPDVGRLRDHWQQSMAGLDRAMTQKVQKGQHQLAIYQAKLALLGPSATLKRGFAIVRGPTGDILNNAAQVQANQAVSIHLSKGTVHATVTATQNDESEVG